ncbi:hypothetical protein TWF481_010248 [Arthrobotrys musiformis]|uniref:Peptidase S54 rhomboid domain-containing protein n=1 Tax=Arthrobotrys musiformis TaxID=47236 RepID=A0AAV9W249_9PEZI
MNVPLGLRLTSQLFSRPCLQAGARTLLISPLHTPLSLLRPPTSRTIWTSILPKSTIERPKSVSLIATRFVSFNRRARPSPRTRQAPSLPPPPEPTIARPATLTGGAEQEPIRYADYVRPPSDSSEPPPPPPVSPTQRAISRYISLFGVIFLGVHIIWWLPYLSGLGHADEKEKLGELGWFAKYVNPWRDLADRWLTFNPSIAFERLGLNAHPANPAKIRTPSGEEFTFSGYTGSEGESVIAKVTQFLLPTVSHAEVWHLAFNFFALQALSPTIVRYYGFKRALLAYPLIGGLGLALVLVVDRFTNPYTHLDRTTAMLRYRDTDPKQILQQTGRKVTPTEQSEHWLLGQHCRNALGASGVLTGFLAITAIVNPMAKFELMFIPVGISVRTLFMGFVTFDLVGIGMRNEGMGNIGHLAGAVAGIAVWALWLRRVKLPDQVRRQLMMGLRRKKMGLE